MYKGWKILKGGEGEPTPEELAATQAEKDAAKSLEDAKGANAVLQAQIDKLTASGKDMEEMLLDPAYTKYLEDQKNVSQKKDTDAVADMTNGQLMEHMMGKFQEMIDTSTEGLSGEAAAQRASQDIAAVRAKNSDFDLYKPEMIKIATSHPSLGAAQVFALAKAETGPKKAPELKGGSLPNNNSPGGKPSPKGFVNQADQAWKDSGIEAILNAV